MVLSFLLSLLLIQGATRATETGVVAGALRYPDGRPAVGVRVAAMVAPEAGLNSREASTLVALGQTDDSGRYRLEGVPPGKYFIVAGQVSAPTYYPGARDLAGATAVEIRANATVAQIDFEISEQTALPPRRSPLPGGFSFSLPNLSNMLPLAPPTVPISGRIVIKDAPPATPMPPQIIVDALAPASRPNITSNTPVRVPVAADGTFTVPLQSGDWRIQVRGLPEGYSVVSITSGSVDVQRQSFSAQPSANLVITLGVDLRPRFRVSGRVLENGTDRPLLGEHVELAPQTPQTGPLVRLIINAEGRFDFRRLLPGTYVLRLPSSGLQMPEQQVTITDSDVTIELRARTQ
jgi:hypothetical protein